MATTTQDAPFDGRRIPPCWQILSPDEAERGDGIAIVLTSRQGFGTGGHATTQLCLRAIAALAPRDGAAWRMLDFGSGSGILAIGAAKLGARVAAVEIDPASRASIAAHARLNEVSDRVAVTSGLAEVEGPCELIVANILRSVLLEFAPELVARLAPGGSLVLAGLVTSDVPEVSVRYAALIGGKRPERYPQGDWNALVWRGSGSGREERASHYM